MNNPIVVIVRFAKCVITVIDTHLTMYYGPQNYTTIVIVIKYPQINPGMYRRFTVNALISKSKKSRNKAADP